MRDTKKNELEKELILEDGSCYLYTKVSFEMKTALGAVEALLDEYSFTKKDTSETFKLYRTSKDGNWYSLGENTNTTQTQLFLELKTAISNL